MQDNVVALAEQQRRIARMHRQLEAAMANGAMPDPAVMASSAEALTADAKAAASVRSLDQTAGSPTELFSAKAATKTLVHDVEHGEGWLVLVGQVALAVALGSGYERFRSWHTNVGGGSSSAYKSM
jgi:hypothetical protein